jgi:CubicO group peptidase (beta-lactamase class C family)
VKVNENTMFEACSMSKPVFAYFVLKMVDKGIIALDSPLYKYTPYPDIAYDERYKLFTARMVLSHTTGLPNWHQWQPPDSSLNVPKGAQYIMFQPGTKFSYSGEGYQYLVDVMVKLLHTTPVGLDSIVDKEVCGPFGMAHAHFGWNDYVASHKAIGYKQTNNDGVNKKGELKKFEEFSAAGGLHTNAIDYARFMIAMRDGKGLSKKSNTEMLSPQAEITDTSWTGTNGKHWGLGIAIKETPYGTRYLHSGNNGDFQCFAVIFKDQRSGFVFLTNCNRSGDLFDKLEPLFMEGKL